MRTPTKTFRAQCEKKPGDDDEIILDIAVTGELAPSIKGKILSMAVNI